MVQKETLSSLTHGNFAKELSISQGKVPPNAVDFEKLVIGTFLIDKKGLDHSIDLLKPEVFYDPRHPYTWGLLSAMPDLDTDDDRLCTIPGSPPNLLHEKAGDAFAPRNVYALAIDDKLDPPMFQITDSHCAATWLLDPRAPRVEMPTELKRKIERMKKEAERYGGEL